MVSEFNTCDYSASVYHSIAGYVEVREKILSILQAFVEPIATLPYGNMFSPQKSSPQSTWTRLIHVQRQKMTSFFKLQTHRARKRLLISFWMAWRVRNAVDSKIFTYFLTICLCQQGQRLEACLMQTPEKAISYLA